MDHELHHMKVDIYGPIDLFSYSSISHDHIHSPADLIWHGVIINNNNKDSAAEPAATTEENIRGTTLNQLFLIYFNLYGRDANPNNQSQPNEQLQLPGGSLVWKGSSENVFSFFSTLCPLDAMLVRVAHVLEAFLAGLATRRGLTPIHANSGYLIIIPH